MNCPTFSQNPCMRGKSYHHTNMLASKHTFCPSQVCITCKRLKWATNAPATPLIAKCPCEGLVCPWSSPVFNIHLFVTTCRHWDSYHHTPMPWDSLDSCLKFGYIRRGLRFRHRAWWYSGHPEKECGVLCGNQPLWLWVAKQNVAFPLSFPQIMSEVWASVVDFVFISAEQ